MTVEQLINRLQLLGTDAKDYKVVVYDSHEDMFHGISEIITVISDKEVELVLKS